MRRRLAVLAGFVLMLSGGCSPTPHVFRPLPQMRAPAPTVEPLPTGSVDGSLPPGYSAEGPTPVVNAGERTGHRVALTFDADMTTAMAVRLASGQAHSYANLRVIDILERQRVPATFFLTGMWVERYPDVTRRLAANPDFELANHTWSHRAYAPNCYALPEVPAAEMASEITRTFDIIRPYGGHQTHYFRFPGLCLNPAALAAIQPTHVTAIQGDVVSGDPGATVAAPIVRAVLSRVRAGSIVVMHITEDNARMTDQALPDILEGLRQRGLQPVRLSELLGSEP